MTGTREPYVVEDVGDVLFFFRSDALHAAFWHDHFGWPVSHGCVNLAPSDAEWLFDWAPPALPAGWQSAVTQPKEESLWVVVEQGRVDWKALLDAPVSAPAR